MAEEREIPLFWAILGALVFWIIAILVIVSLCGYGGYESWNAFAYIAAVIQPAFGIAAILSWIIGYCRRKKSS